MNELQNLSGEHHHGEKGKDQTNQGERLLGVVTYLPYNQKAVCASPFVRGAAVPLSPLV